MAEMAVSFARDKLLALLSDEAKLLWNIPKEFEDIQNELQHIQGSLKMADRRAAEEGDNNTNKGIKKWVKDLREASFLIEDVIDQYIIYVEQHPHDAFGCAALLFECDFTHLIESLKRRHQIASEIQQIKSIVDEIHERGKKYNFLSQLSSDQWIDPRLDSRLLDEAEVVGLEDPRDELIHWLVEGPVERTVISVVGMGGLGKTTLAGRVFNNQKVIAHFDCRAWITVSQSYTAEGLLSDLLKKLCKEKMVGPPRGISEMDRDSLIDEVRIHLQYKRYVVIFDDVWSVNLWGQIENAMLDNKNGSRILITTRMNGVVDSCMKSPYDKVHKLKLLTQEESMQLFCKKAFRYHNNGCCPEDLVNISSDLVDKCKGLPLAIVAIGNLLSGKEKTPFQWEKIRRSLSSEMEKNPHLIGITKILDISYDDLPYYLKSCLLYFGVYPKGYEVNLKRLIWQWIAEWFVKDEEGKTLEETARQYLSELIGRGLVQVSSFSIDDKAKNCRVHDLLHDMILRKSKYLSFSQHIGKEEESMSIRMVRRLSIENISNDLMGSTESLHTLSLLVFEDEEALIEIFVQRIATKYKLLKVLDFKPWAVRKVYVPENLGNLTHLKYLNLRYSNMPIELPKFICKLHNLETLDIRHTLASVMPKEFCKLRKLRHLLGDYMDLFQLKNGLGDMTSLQTLHDVQLTMVDDDDRVEIIKDDIEIELIRELEKLKQLRDLSLKCLKEKHGSAICSSINEMTKLEKLTISSWGVIDLPTISSLPMLRKLCLKGELKRFPEWIPQLQSLVKLTLDGSEKLTEDSLKSLQNMPYLMFLEMSHAYIGKRLYFEDGGFKQLKELYLRSLISVNSITIERGALHSLKKLELWNIPKLKTAPTGIQHLEKLQVLRIIYMQTEFNKGFFSNGGSKNPIIQHVPCVEIITG